MSSVFPVIPAFTKIKGRTKPVKQPTRLELTETIVDVTLSFFGNQIAESLTG